MMRRRDSRPALAGLALAVAIGAAGCGAKTGLELVSRDSGVDAGMDAGMDAGPDAGPDAAPDSGPDAAVCVPGTVRLERSRVEVVFVVDRSGSMRANFDGLSPIGTEPSRWELLALSMARALEAFDDSVSVGAKFFPSRSNRVTPDPCAVFEGLDVPIGANRSDAVVSQFPRWNPAGGTPVGPAAREALDSLLARTEDNTAQFIVVATDGEPTCGDDPVGEVLSVVQEAHEVHSVDVFVVGIASTAPEVALLDTLAVSGGRPRPESEETRFYDARNPDLLGDLLAEITSDLAQCVFAVPFPPGEDDTVEVRIEGGTVPRDEGRTAGWDWTSEARGQLSLFGAPCEAARSGAAVRAIITCGD